MKQDEVLELFSIFHENNPEPGVELNYINRFTLVIAVLLSAQSTDKGVNKATKRLFMIAPNPELMLNLGEENLKEHIKTIGLYNNKAKNIIALSRKLITDNVIDIPDDFEYLISLPGIGRKSANVILSVLFKRETIGVDTHVFRTSNRIGLTIGDSVLEVEKQLMQVVPKKFLRKCHYWLVLHGRYICKAKNPMCAKCSINHLCKFQQKNFKLL